MLIPPHIRTYGDTTFRGKCPTEEVEQATFFNRLRLQYPKTWGAIALHIRNEGKGSAIQTKKFKVNGGYIPGASDIIIPGSPTLVIEMKRRDHTQSKWQDGQQEYLTAAHNAGAFACLAFGYEAAWEAFQEWLALNQK